MVRLLREKFVKSEREGSALVSVVIGVLFLAAIGIIILTAANQYFISVSVDHNSAKNFYEAEKILEEVKTGLLEYAGNAASDAYRDVLENYSADKGTKREVFSRKYFSLLATKLRPDDAGSFELDDDKVGVAQSAELEKLQVLATNQEAVTTTAGHDLAFVIEKDDDNGEYTFVIHNLLINYENEDMDYRSSIQTDIRLGVPDYSLEGNSTFDEMKDYISISDNTLTVDSTGKGVNFVGNIYTGNEEQGILLRQGSESDFKSSIIVSRGDLEVRNETKASFSGEVGVEGGEEGETEPGELYLENIHLKSDDEESTLETSLKINENAYIANDLNIESNNATVELGGKYYGYSYNKENAIAAGDASATTSSDYSSAILVNGYKTTLNADNLNSLVLAGRAFVSREGETVSDIMMGESVSVKSNQLAYLVPDEFIVSTATGAGDYHNPVLKAEYGKVSVNKEGLKNKEITLKKQNGTEEKIKLGTLLAEDPVEENFHTIDADNGYVFYYLKFKDDASANRFFEAYYYGESTDEDGESIIYKDELKSKGKVYVGNSDLNIKIDDKLYLVAGNIMNNYLTKNASSLQTETYFGADQKPDGELLTEGLRMGQSYVKHQLFGLSIPEKTKTAGNAMRLAEDELPLVSDYIIDFSSEGFTTGKTTWETADTGVDGAVIRITTGNYTVSSPFTGLLIAGGDVTVSSNFTGLILTKGKVTVTNGCTLKSDMITVGKLFDYIRTDETLSSIFRELNGTVTKRPDNLEDCISYENWMKNEE